MDGWTHQDQVHIFGHGDETEWIVSTAVGGSYFSQWLSAVSSTWVEYAMRHGLGIAVFVSDIDQDSEQPRHGAWQKLLAPRALASMLNRDVRCLLLDTDVLISPRASNIFELVEPKSIGVVSQQKNLPLEYLTLRRRIAFLRQRFLDQSFPLASGLVALPQDLLRMAGLEVHEDYFCSGVVVLDSRHHADLFADWYFRAPSSEEYSQVDWGEQLWLNHCVQGRGDVQWLDYKWQALWLYEVAAYFPFLYADRVHSEVAQWCLAASLLRNNFVHLAGRWEQELLEAWTPILPRGAVFGEVAIELEAHEKLSAPGIPQGVIAPKISQRKA